MAVVIVNGPNSSPREAGRLGDPRLTPFLPMLYVAWADGNLSADEIRGICARISQVEGLEGDCRGVLGSWLDPERPPSAQELQTLLTVIRRAARRLSADERRSLTELGIQLAQVDGEEIAPPIRRALEQIEAALGIAGPEATRALMVSGRPPTDAPPRSVAFDIAALSRLLDGEHRDLRRSVRHLLSQPAFSYCDGLSRAEYRAQVLTWCRELARQGLGALGLPVEYGGRDDPAALIAVFETLAYHDLSLVVKFGVQFGLFAGSVHQLGTERHHRVYLEPAASLEMPGCFAMTETGHGSNVQDLETVARYDATREEFVIDTPHPGARKDYIGNAAEHGQLATVFAHLEIDEESYGVHAFLVPIRDAEGLPLNGVRIEDCGEKLGLNGVDNGRLGFDRVRVPRLALLNRFADVDAAGRYTSPITSSSRRFFTMLGTLIGGRVSIAHAAVSASRSALTIAVRYADHRRQFGPPGRVETALLDYRSHQRRLLPWLATTYALDFALKHLVREFVASPAEERRTVEALAAGLKVFATRRATETIQACREACGGQGYLAENRFAALKADSDVFTTFEGDNTVLLQLVAKGLLLDYRDQFGDLGVLSVARYVAAAAATAITELNPIVTRLTDEEHLRDSEFQLAALRWRESHLLSTAARRLKKRIDRGAETHEAFNDCQTHLLELASAHVERVVLEQFMAGIEACDDADLAAVLTLMRSLFALWTIEQDRGWFLEHGYLEAAKSKAIRKQVGMLCAEVREQALPLVEAFDIPDTVLAAPIAKM